MILVIGIVVFAFWYGVRFAACKNKRNDEGPDVVEKAELDASESIEGRIRQGQRDPGVELGDEKVELDGWSGATVPKALKINVVEIWSSKCECEKAVPRL